MSTEHQQYSTENQRDKIREYAVRRGIEIICTYADEGKSGLRIDGRAALQRLIKDVENGTADFQVILVYDVTKTTAPRSPPSSRASSGRWPASTAANSPPRSLPASAG